MLTLELVRKGAWSALTHSRERERERERERDRQIVSLSKHDNMLYTFPHGMVLYAPNIEGTLSLRK